jgi:hypothetical protein
MMSSEIKEKRMHVKMLDEHHNSEVLTAQKTVYAAKQEDDRYHGIFDKKDGEYEESPTSWNRRFGPPSTQSTRDSPVQRSHQSTGPMHHGRVYLL